jgi:uncharacterized membrane protein YccF (DUF307 family)
VGRTGWRLRQSLSKAGSSILVRAVWYLFVGWWLTGFAMAASSALAIPMIGLPITFYLVNRISTLLTLRPRAQQFIGIPLGLIVVNRLPFVFSLHCGDA